VSPKTFRGRTFGGITQGLRSTGFEKVVARLTVGPVVLAWAEPGNTAVLAERGLLGLEEETFQERARRSSPTSKAVGPTCVEESW